MTRITAEVIADSINSSDVRLTTVKLEFPRVILPQILMHRMFSRSVSSNRAIPTKRIIQQVKDDPALAVEWRYRQKGMQPAESMSKDDTAAAKELERRTLEFLLDIASEYDKLHAAKETVNRYLELFEHVQMLVTSTDWSNFFNLRIDDAAQVQIQMLARAIKSAMDSSSPEKMIIGEWHLPFKSSGDMLNSNTMQVIKACTARCARVSYWLHDGSEPTYEDDIRLHDMLLEKKHFNPFEHCAYSTGSKNRYRNFRGFRQYRDLIDCTSFEG